MRKHQKWLMVLAITAAFFTALAAFITISASAGREGGLLRALEGIGFAPISQTGQTNLYATGDDGDLQW